MTTTQTALITGGGKRIGRSISECLAHAGYRVVIHARAGSLAQAEALAQELHGQGQEAETLVADLENPDALPDLIAQADARNDLTLLVNNASLFEPDRAEDFDLALYRRHLAVNLTAPLVLSQAFHRHIRARGDNAYGAIINVLDQRVIRPNPLFFSYSVSKTALWHSTITLAQSFAPYIRVNGVGPGPVLPNIHDGADAFSREVAGTLLKKAVSPEEIAKTVLWLAQATSVTGQMIAVDSGQHLGWLTPDIDAERV